MTDRLLCLMVVLLSGNAAVTARGRELVYIGALAVLAVVWLWRGLALTRRDLAVLSVFAAISAVHVATFGAAAGTASAGFLVRLSLAWLAVRTVPGFHRHYLAVMTLAAALSLAFYLPVVAGVDLAGTLAPLRVHIPGTEMAHIGLHNFHLPQEASRNSGFFGEPGMFAGYLILAMLLALVGREPLGAGRWALLVTTLLTTQSTTGYLALLGVALTALISANLEQAGRRVLQAMALGLVLSGVSAAAYDALPFLREKIQVQLEQAVDQTDASRINRIGNLVYDLEHVAARPLLGWSPRTVTREAVDADVESMASVQGNGLSGFATKFGLLGLALYLGTTWVMLRDRRGSALVASSALAVLAVTLLGEQYLNASLFLTTMFADTAPAAAGAAGQAGGVEPDAQAGLPASSA